MSQVEWKECALGEIISLVIDYRGKTPKKLGGDWCDSGYRALSAKNIKTGKIVQEESIRFVDEDLYKKWMKDEIQREDILITSEAPFGQIFYWDSEEKIVLSQRLFALRIKNEFCPQFIYYYMTTDAFQAELDARSTGTTVVGLRQPELMKCKIAFPPLEEQKRIAGILSSLDDKIELNNQINDNLEKQAQALFKNWFIDYAPFGGQMPEDWRELPVAELCDSISKTHDYNKKDLIFLNTGDIERGVFLHRNYSPVKDMPGQAKKSIKKNDILYSEIRPANGHYAFVDFDAEDFVVSTKLMVIRSNNINPYRLYNFLTSQDVVAELQTEADSRSGTFPQIRFENIQRLTMIIASEEIEAKFSEMLECIYKQVFANIKENQRLTTLRDTLLPKLMSGES